MRSPHYFIVKPKDEQRYNNTKKIGGQDVIINDTLDDGHTTNREAIVIETPIAYKGDVEVGDTIIVHHNTFRVLRNQRGVMTNSKKHIKDNLFWVDDYYLHIKKDGQVISKYPYVFFKALMTDDIEHGVEKDRNKGVLAFNCSELKDELEIGKTYYFKEGVNAPYTINDEEYYRVKINNILAVD